MMTDIADNLHSSMSGDSSVTMMTDIADNLHSSMSGDSSVTMMTDIADNLHSSMSGDSSVPKLASFSSELAAYFVKASSMSGSSFRSDRRPSVLERIELSRLSTASWVESSGEPERLPPRPSISRTRRENAISV